eukprot:6088802-Amphidinium_carterae.2
MISGTNDNDWSAWSAHVVDEYPCYMPAGQALNAHVGEVCTVRSRKQVRFNPLVQESMHDSAVSNRQIETDSECSALCDREVLPQTNTVGEDCTMPSHFASLSAVDSVEGVTCHGILRSTYTHTASCDQDHTFVSDRSALQEMQVNLQPHVSFSQCSNLTSSVYLRPTVRGTQTSNASFDLPSDIHTVDDDDRCVRGDTSASLEDDSQFPDPTPSARTTLEQSLCLDGRESHASSDEASDEEDMHYSAVEPQPKTFLEECMSSPFPPNPDFTLKGTLQTNEPGQGVSVQLHSFNVNGWKTNHANVLAALNNRDPHIVALQETLLDSTSGRAADGLINRLGFKAIWGNMVDPVYNSKSVLRCDRSSCPGVAFIFSKRLDVAPLVLHTQGAKTLFNSGRLVAIRVSTPHTPVLLYNIYLPSGADAQEERETCYRIMFEELACQPGLPIVILGDLNEHVDRNALACQLSLQGWRRPHYVDTEGHEVQHTYQCGNVSSTIDGFYLSPLAFPAVHSIVVRRLHGQKGILQHSLLSAEIQICDTEPVTRPPRPVAFKKGPEYNQHSPVDWKRETRQIQTQLANVLQDYRTETFTSWSLDLDNLWTYYQQRLYCHLVACNEVDTEYHGDDFCCPSAAEFVSARPAIQQSKPPNKSRKTGPMRIRAHLYRLIDAHRNPQNKNALRRIKEDRDFICSTLRFDHDTFDKHVSEPQTAIPIWKASIERYMCRYRDAGIKKWQRSLIDKNGQITRKCYHWLKRELLPNHFALYDGTTIRTGPREFFQHCREYWSKLMNRSEDERQAAFLSVRSHPTTPYEPLDHDIDVLKSCLKKVKVHAAGGLDRWSGSAMKLIPDEALTALLCFYKTFEETAHFPPQLTWARMHLIPKFSSGVGRVEDYRPISVMSFFYRLWSAYRLKMLGSSFYDYFPSEMRGGLPGRDYGDMLSSIMLDIESALSHPSPDAEASEVFWFSLDAQKCFDNIGYVTAFHACESAGLPKSLIRALGSMWLDAQRFVSAGGQVCETPFKTCNSIFQGCCLSVIACLCLVVLWSKAVRGAHESITTPSYVDDRYIRTPDMHTMMRAAEASRQWEYDNKFILNVKKSALVQIPSSNQQLVYESCPLPEPSCVTSLGTEIPLKYRSAGALQRKRIQTTIRTGLRIHSLHLPLPLAQNLVETAMLPQLSHNINATVYTKKSLQCVRSIVKRACRMERRAHSFEVCAALLTRPHRYDPESQILYTHIVSLVRSLRFRGQALITWQELVKQHLYTIPRGPRGVYLAYLSRLSIKEHEDALTLTHPSLGSIHLLDSDWHACAHWLRACIKYRLLAHAQSRRHRLDGAADCDVAVTTALYRSKSCVCRPELASIMSDSLWCLHKKFVCELASDELCCFCDSGENETVEHALWQCEAWADIRTKIPRSILIHIGSMKSSARLCGICPQTAPAQCKTDWPLYQTVLAQVWKARMTVASSRGMTGRMPRRTSEGESCEGMSSTGGHMYGARVEMTAQVAPDPLPPAAVWHGSRPISFELCFVTCTANFPFQYGREQYNKLSRFVAKIRVPDVEHRPLVPTCTLLELYLSYVQCNGGSGFCNFFPSSQYGDRIAWQLEAWRHALISFQHIANTPLLVQMVAPAFAQWPKALGLTPMEEVPTRVLIPHWKRVREILHEFPFVLGGLLTGTETKGTEPWRKWVPCIAGTQMRTDTIGGIPCNALMQRHRLTRPVPWQWQSYKARVWLDRLLDSDCSEILGRFLGGQTLYAVLLHHGIRSQAELRSIAIQQSVIIRRTRMLLDHNHARGRGHCCETARSIRIYCARCNFYGSFAFKCAWLRQHCSIGGGGPVYDFDVRLNAESIDARNLAAAVSSLTKQMHRTLNL